MDEGLLDSALVVGGEVADHGDGVEYLQQLLVLAVDLLHEVAVELDGLLESYLHPAVLDVPLHLLVDVLLELLLEAVQRLSKLQVQLNDQLQGFDLSLLEDELEPVLRGQQDVLVVLDQLFRELPVEDVLGGDDEATLGDLPLRPVEAVHLREVLARVQLL